MKIQVNLNIMKVVKKMKKIFSFIILFVGLFTVNARANSIDKMDIDIFIDNNGNAHVTETWNGNYSSKTELYKEYANLGNSKITNYKVSMDGRDFTTISSWDIDASFDEKAYKAGLHDTSDGVELCMGISEYGTHKYTLTYDIEGFVAEIDGNQIVYWGLIPTRNYETNAYIKIHTNERFSDELPVWGYGNYGGYAYVYDGYIEMSNEHLKPDEYMTILIKFPPETFNTQNKIDGDFDYYYDMAENGATHYTEKKNIFAEIFSIVVTLFIPFMFIFLFVASTKGTNKSGSITLDFGDTGSKLPKDVNMFRDIPCNKDIYRAYWIAHNYKLMKKQTDFLGTIILKWHKNNKIRIESSTKDGLFKKEETNIIFNSIETVNFDTELEKTLYRYMYEASKDGILESREFEKWCKTHYSKILNWFDDVLDYENERLKAEGKLVDGKKKTLIISTKVCHVDPSMKEEAIQMKGLKEFFKEFDNMSDKEAIEVMLWEEYLMYAQIFGVADKVAKQFKKLYPEVITDYDYDSIVYINSMSHSAMVSASAAKSRAESYSAGGGGFSSGGGGGGSFGGGGSMGSR